MREARTLEFVEAGNGGPVKFVANQEKCLADRRGRTIQGVQVGMHAPH